jgi:hypothetical protein
VNEESDGMSVDDNRDLKDKEHLNQSLLNHTNHQMPRLCEQDKVKVPKSIFIFFFFHDKQSVRVGRFLLNEN